MDPIVKDEDHIEDLRLLFEALPAGFPRRGVIHVGAHQGQEVAEYFQQGFERVVLIEANPVWGAYLKERFGGDDRIRIFETAISNAEGMVTLQVHTSRRGSTEPASILPMKEFKRIVTALHTPETVEVPAITLDGLCAREGLAAGDYSLLNIDIQGAEKLAFEGADEMLRAMDGVITEVALLELYEGQALEAELLAFLASRGFTPQRTVYHTMYERDRTFPAWGECLLVREGS